MTTQTDNHNPRGARVAVIETRADGHVLDVPPLPYGEWEIAPAGSRVTFAVRKFGLLTVRGALGPISGAIVSAPDAEPSGAGTIELEGLATGIARRDEHLLSPDYLDASAHPWIGISAGTIEIAGTKVRTLAEMTIRGRTRPVLLTGTLESSGTEGSRELCLRGRIDRRDFGVERGGVFEWAGFAVGRAIELEARLALCRRER